MAAPKKKPDMTDPDMTDPENYYAESTWRGNTRFMCSLCSFDTLERDQIIAHARGVHIPIVLRNAETLAKREEG